MKPGEPFAIGSPKILGAPSDWVAEVLMRQPSRLEDTYATPVVVVELGEAVLLSSPGRTIDAPGDHDEHLVRDRRDRSREKQRAAAAAWRRDRDDPVGAAIREVYRPKPREPFVERRWWRLPCGTVVGVQRPRERNWPRHGTPDPTWFREERRLRDLADMIELGPVVRNDRTTADADWEVREIDLEIVALREMADAIRAARERGVAADQFSEAVRAAVYGAAVREGDVDD